MNKLAIIISHPIQYYVPWFRHLATDPDLSIRVFYLWNFGVTEQIDPGFQQTIQWDIPLLDGYDHEFVLNVSSDPGTHHIWGLDNPTLQEQVREYAPDAVLLMNYNYISTYQFLWQWTQTPLLFRGDSHCLMQPRGLKAWLRKQWISAVYQRLSACLYVGQANYNYFRHHGVPEDRLFFAPHAIENDRFMTQSTTATQQAQLWKDELGIPANHAVIVFAGKFISKKRPLDLLQAFIQADLANTSLLLVGGGSLESELREQAIAHSHIHFAPFQNQSMMPRTYAIADLVVLPSYGPSETWGLAINEAMCLGKPVIVSDHVGCGADLVQSERNGLIFPAGDVSKLADALKHAMSDRQRLKQWGVESRRIISHYSYERTTHGLKNALHCVQTKMSCLEVGLL
ncbi:MAG TPA: glycosyltransferase family 4 protein [Crinalium sp.]